MDRRKIVERGTHDELSEGRRAGYIVSRMRRSLEGNAFSIHRLYGYLPLAMLGYYVPQIKCGFGGGLAM